MEPKKILSGWGTGIVFLSLLLLFFTIPHTLEDFASGEPARANAPAALIAYIVSGLFALQGLALFLTGRQNRIGTYIHAILGLLWPLAAGVTQIPRILSPEPYRAGFISEFYVGGIIVIGILLSFVSIQYLRIDGKT